MQGMVEAIPVAGRGVLLLVLGVAGLGVLRVGRR